MELLAHFPSLDSPADGIYWEDDENQLQFVVPVETAATRIAFRVLYMHKKGSPWSAWFNYLAEGQPRPYMWQTYIVADDTDPAEFLEQLRIETTPR